MITITYVDAVSAQRATLEIDETESSEHIAAHHHRPDHKQKHIVIHAVW